MPRLSLVIVAQNEERTIGRVLDAAREIADEIILVDSGSADKTQEIAAQRGARVVHQDWLGYAAQKNFAIGLASGDWILSLDADEILTPGLVQEIKGVLDDPASTEYDGFKIPRLLYIGDSAVRHGGFYPDAQLRLIRRNAGLKHHMEHFSYVDVQGFEEAMEKYARLHAQEFASKPLEKKDKGALYDITRPAWTFFYRYILRAGFLDGALGLTLNLKYSSYVSRKIRYLRELRESAAK
jgi:glycosyltransferase involved in cell wall biosynthesis